MNIPYRGSKGPLHLLIDSTGIKVEGEWHARRSLPRQYLATRKSQTTLDHSMKVASQLARTPTVSTVAPARLLASHPDIGTVVHEGFNEAVAALNERPDELSAMIKEQNFPELDAHTWDVAFGLGVAGMLPRLSMSEDGWNVLLDMLKANNPDHDFSNVGWTDIIHEAARRN